MAKTSRTGNSPEQIAPPSEDQLGASGTIARPNPQTGKLAQGLAFGKGDGDPTAALADELGAVDRLRRPDTRESVNGRHTPATDGEDWPANGVPVPAHERAAQARGNGATFETAVAVGGGGGGASTLDLPAGTGDDTRDSDDEAGVPGSDATAGIPAEPALAGRPPADFRFHIDEVSDQQIGGWIIRAEEPAHRCIVALREGDRTLTRTIASRFRADLAAAGIGDGCHAFVIEAPAELLDGEEHLLDLIEQDSGLALTGAPIHWRSERVARQTALTGMSDRMGAARLFGLGRQPGAEADSGLIRTWSDAGGDPRPPVAEAARWTGLRGQSATPTRVSTRLLFDVSDLIYYIGEHANLTGIQRVQSSIVLAILGNRVFPAAALTFLSFNAKTRNWVAIPTGFLFTLLEDLFLPQGQRLVSFPAEEARYGMLPGAQEFSGVGVLDDGSSSVLCLLGAAWVHQDYLHRVLALKRQFGTKFVMTVHDLIPIYARETCDQDTARVFEEFMQRALRHVDHVLSVSENTAADVRRYTTALQIPEPPLTVTQNGSSFAEFLPEGQVEGDLRAEEIPERFVLFVATIEGRKNHDLMLRIWQRMVMDGDDPPHLVCVGRLGWKSNAFISALVETDYLDGRVHLLRDISDTDLRMLYRKCLFTVCPTFYEGWGLPVGESLAMGKICVSSNRASVPEVAGAFGTYIDIDDFAGCLAAIRDLVGDAAKRKRLEAKIRRGFKPVTWHAVADRVVEACLTASRIKWRQPYPDTAVPYSSEVSFGRLDRNVDGTGELLLTRIAGARKGLFLSESLDDQAFRRGEEVRTGGHWAYPEEWGTWACHSGGDIVLALADNPSVYYYVFVRLRPSAPVVDRVIRISANGDVVWEGSLGPHPRDVALRVRRKLGSNGGGWRLRLRAQIDLTPELRSQIAALDARIPTIGFERLIVVPENDLKTRLDIVYTLLL